MGVYRRTRRRNLESWASDFESRGNDFRIDGAPGVQRSGRHHGVTRGSWAMIDSSTAILLSERRFPPSPLYVKWRVSACSVERENLGLTLPCHRSTLGDSLFLIQSEHCSRTDDNSSRGFDFCFHKPIFMAPDTGELPARGADLSSTARSQHALGGPLVLYGFELVAALPRLV